MKIYNRYEILKGQTGPEHGREDLLTDFRNVKVTPIEEPRDLRYRLRGQTKLLAMIDDIGWFDYATGERLNDEPGN